MFFDRRRKQDKNSERCCSSASGEPTTENRLQYRRLFTVTCEGSPYQLRDGDIIRDKNTGDWYMVESTVFLTDSPSVVVTPYKPFFLDPDEHGELVGFEHMFISNSGSYAIYAVENDIKEPSFISPELSANPNLFDQLD